MKTEKYENYGDFLARSDKKLNGVSTSFASLHPEFEKQNETNEACWNCSRCSDCSRCAEEEAKLAAK